MRLAERWFLLLMVSAFVPWLWARRRPRVAWPTLQGLDSVRGWKAWFLANAPLAIKGVALGLLVVALARPQTVAGRTRRTAQGVSIVVAIDQSSSMNQVDGGAESRLEAARRALSEFVANRADDSIGLVVFANYPDLACPPTLDHAFLLDTLRAVRPARPGDDGTNLGDAIAWSLDALRDAPTSKKVLILLTDGRNSPAVPRPTDPLQAATLARELGVTLHTIAVGHAGGTVHAVDPITKLEVGTNSEGPDQDLLRRLADAGGGRSFTAAAPRALSEVFGAINALEKSPVRGEVRTRYREEYAPWAATALGLLVAESLLASGPWRRLP